MGVISHCLSPLALKTSIWIPMVAVTAAKRHFPHLLSPKDGVSLAWVS